MAPEFWTEHLLKMAPWRLLGEPWAALGQPSGGPGAPRPILERFWVPLGTPFGGSKLLENVLESHLKFVVNSELSFGPSGGRGGPFWARFWGHVGSILDPQARSRETPLTKSSEGPKVNPQVDQKGPPGGVNN